MLQKFCFSPVCICSFRGCCVSGSDILQLLEPLSDLEICAVVFAGMNMCPFIDVEGKLDLHNYQLLPWLVMMMIHYCSQGYFLFMWSFQELHDVCVEY